MAGHRLLCFLRKNCPLTRKSRPLPPRLLLHLLCSAPRETILAARRPASCQPILKLRRLIQAGCIAPISLPEFPRQLLQARAQRLYLEDVSLASGANAIAYAPIVSIIASLASASFHMTSPLSGLARDVESERRLPRTGTLSCQASAESPRLAYEVCPNLAPALAEAAGHAFPRTASHRSA